MPSTLWADTGASSTVKLSFIRDILKGRNGPEPWQAAPGWRLRGWHHQRWAVFTLASWHRPSAVLTKMAWEKNAYWRLGVQGAAPSLGLKLSPHLQLPAAADLGNWTVTEVSPENSDTRVTGVTGWWGWPGEAWGALATRRFGWPQRSHDFEACPRLVPSFDDARVWGASHLLTSFVMISHPCHEPHSGCAQQQTLTRLAKWAGRRRGTTSGTRERARGQACGASQACEVRDSQAGKPSASWGAASSVAGCRVAARPQCTPAGGQVQSFPWRCSTRRQPLTTYKVRPALFGYASQITQSLAGPCSARRLGRASSVAEEGVLWSERGPSSGEDLRAHINVSVFVSIFTFI